MAGETLTGFTEADLGLVSEEDFQAEFVTVEADPDPEGAFEAVVYEIREDGQLYAVSTRNDGTKQDVPHGQELSGESGEKYSEALQALAAGAVEYETEVLGVEGHTDTTETIVVMTYSRTGDNKITISHRIETRPRVMVPETELLDDTTWQSPDSAAAPRPEFVTFEIPSQEGLESSESVKLAQSNTEIKKAFWAASAPEALAPSLLDFLETKPDPEEDEPRKKNESVFLTTSIVESFPPDPSKAEAVHADAKPENDNAHPEAKMPKPAIESAPAPESKHENAQETANPAIEDDRARTAIPQLPATPSGPTGGLGLESSNDIQKTVESSEVAAELNQDVSTRELHEFAAAAPHSERVSPAISESQEASRAMAEVKLEAHAVESVTEAKPEVVATAKVIEKTNAEVAPLLAPAQTIAPEASSHMESARGEEPTTTESTTTAAVAPARVFVPASKFPPETVSASSESVLYEAKSPSVVTSAAEPTTESSGSQAQILRSREKHSEEHATKVAERSNKIEQPPQVAPANENVTAMSPPSVTASFRPAQIASSGAIEVTAQADEREAVRRRTPAKKMRQQVSPIHRSVTDVSPQSLDRLDRQLLRQTNPAFENERLTPKDTIPSVEVSSSRAKSPVILYSREQVLEPPVKAKHVRIGETNARSIGNEARNGSDIPEIVATPPTREVSAAAELAASPPIRATQPESSAKASPDAMPVTSSVLSSEDQVTQVRGVLSQVKGTSPVAAKSWGEDFVATHPSEQTGQKPIFRPTSSEILGQATSGHSFQMVDDTVIDIDFDSTSGDTNRRRPRRTRQAVV
jgi:hypothetical protein